MRIVIIADDLTGANDSGVQFAMKGLKTSVLLNMKHGETYDDVVIIDTDTRSLSPVEAYQKVKTASEIMRMQAFDIIYKKIDSTFRGNIGAEFDALYEIYSPDFIVFTPAYPEYNRLVKEGNLYLGEQLLHETEFACDPKTPIMESFIPKMIEEQSVHKVGVVTLQDMAMGKPHVLNKLEQFRKNGQFYILFDAVVNNDLQLIVDLFAGLSYRLVWSGSAGLASCLTTMKSQQKITNIAKSEYPVLIVVGSVNKKSRKQLDLILSRPDVMGIKMLAHQVVSDQQALENEMHRVRQQAIEGITANRNIVLYSSGGKDEIALAQKIGGLNGLNTTAVSDRISEVLGKLASGLLQSYPINRLILTGGDTAKQFCQFSNIEKFELIGQVETGVPIGKFSGVREMYGVTKAGGFGTDQVLIHSLRILRGEENICAQ